MNVFLNYFWPIAAFGLLSGAILGSIAFRRQRNALIGVGIAVGIAGAALWHWPLGAADRFATKVESIALFVLGDWEMSQVQAHLHSEPLTRRLMLSGPADDFQRTELVRMMSTIPGVSSATWSDDGGWPLIVEAAGVSVLGFLLGLLLAYLVELRRRHNAQWKW